VEGVASETATGKVFDPEESNLVTPATLRTTGVAAVTLNGPFNIDERPWATADNLSETATACLTWRNASAASIEEEKASFKRFEKQYKNTHTHGTNGSA